MPIHDPDESIGFHFDTEFVDNGVRGVALISLGAVLYFRGHTRKFYAIHRPFFSTTCFPRPAQRQSRRSRVRECDMVM